MKDQPRFSLHQKLISGKSSSQKKRGTFYPASQYYFKKTQGINESDFRAPYISFLMLALNPPLDNF